MWPITLSSRWWKTGRTSRVDFSSRNARSTRHKDFVGQGDLGGGQLGAGGEDELAVQPGLALNRHLVQANAALGDGEEAGEAAVADHRLGAVVLEGLTEFGEQCVTVGGILARLDRVATDHVAPRTEPDFLDLEVVRDRLVAARPGKNLIRDCALAAQGAAEDVIERRARVVLQFAQGRLEELIELAGGDEQIATAEAGHELLADPRAIPLRAHDLQVLVALSVLDDWLDPHEHRSLITIIRSFVNLEQPIAIICHYILNRGLESACPTN
jgi:hypothetical protein